MSTSGSVDFTVSRNEILQSAYEVIGTIAQGQTMSASHIDVGQRWLNLQVKQWQGSADFAPGLKVWSRKRGYIFLQKGQASYSLGPSGDHTATSYSQTTLSGAEASGQTVLSVTTNTGMTAADYIGIVLDTGSIHWTTIVSTSGGPLVTITTQLPSDAASGNTVYWYTTKMRRPISILMAEMRDSSVVDTPMTPLSLEQYESITNKTADGQPTSYYYEAQLTNGVLYLNSEPTDVEKVIRVVFLSNIEDFDAAADTPDYPQEWNLALVMQTGKLLAPVYGAKWTDDMEANRKEAVAIAKNLNPETTELYFQSGGV